MNYRCFISMDEPSHTHNMKFAELTKHFPINNKRYKKSANIKLKHKNCYFSILAKYLLAKTLLSNIKSVSHKMR